MNNLKKTIFDMFTLIVAIANVSDDTIELGVQNENYHVQRVNTKRCYCIISVEIMEFGQHYNNSHFNMFALSVATATVSVDTIIVCVHNYTCPFQSVYTKPVIATDSVDTMEFSNYNKNRHFYMFVLRVATATVSAYKIIFCVHIYN